MSPGCAASTAAWMVLYCFGTLRTVAHAGIDAATATIKKNEAERRRCIGVLLTSHDCMSRPDGAARMRRRTAGPVDAQGLALRCRSLGRAQIRSASRC